MTSSAKILDGGWGWAIVAASFMSQLLAFGSPQSVGVLYPEWLHTYRESKGMTAWVGSLVAGVGLIASPVCSVCVDNFGARPVTIFSGVMVAGGLMLSAFAPNVQFLIFSYGIVVGNRDTECLFKASVRSLRRGQNATNHRDGRCCSFF